MLSSIPHNVYRQRGRVGRSSSWQDTTEHLHHCCPGHNQSGDANSFYHSTTNLELGACPTHPPREDYGGLAQMSLFRQQDVAWFGQRVSQYYHPKYLLYEEEARQSREEEGADPNN